MEPDAWLTSRAQDTALHAAADGIAATINRRTESMVADWDFYIATYLAPTAAAAPRGSDAPEVETAGTGDGVLLRHGASRWSNGFSVYGFDNIGASEGVSDPIEHTGTSTSTSTGTGTGEGVLLQCNGRSDLFCGGYGVFLVKATAEDGMVVRGAGKKAASDIFLVVARDGGLVARLKVVMAVGATYWLQAFRDWVLQSLGSPRYRPMLAWSWLAIVGSPIVQADGSCVICACLVCIEAQHRLAFERRYGPGTFPYKVTRHEDFKTVCRFWGAWSTGGGTEESAVLNLVQSVGGVATDRLPGWEPCYLNVKTHKDYPNHRDKLTPLMLSWLLRTEGPVIGSLFVAKNYYKKGWETRVYRGGGGKRGEANHVVVCTGFKFDFHPKTGEVKMHVEVVDNHREDGPVRKILSTVFTSFCRIEVEPLDARVLRESRSGWLSRFSGFT